MGDTTKALFDPETPPLRVIELQMQNVVDRDVGVSNVSWKQQKSPEYLLCFEVYCMDEPKKEERLSMAQLEDILLKKWEQRVHSVLVPLIKQASRDHLQSELTCGGFTELPQAEKRANLCLVVDNVDYDKIDWFVDDIVRRYACGHCNNRDQNRLLFCRLFMGSQDTPICYRCHQEKVNRWKRSGVPRFFPLYEEECYNFLVDLANAVLTDPVSYGLMSRRRFLLQSATKGYCFGKASQ